VGFARNSTTIFSISCGKHKKTFTSDVESQLKFKDTIRPNERMLKRVMSFIVGVIDMKSLKA